MKLSIKRISLNSSVIILSNIQIILKSLHTFLLLTGGTYSKCWENVKVRLFIDVPWVKHMERTFTQFTFVFISFNENFLKI